MIDRPFTQPHLQSSQQHFAKVPQADIPRSAFNLTKQYKSTFNADYLIPFYLQEILPGDSFKVNCTTFARLATQVVPIMDNLYCDSFFFFVPTRLVWDNWEKFNGAQDDPGDSTDFIMPTMTATAVTGYDVETLPDYFGLPTGIPGYVHRSDPFRSYNLIWNTWFRDENLQDSLVVDKDNGPDSIADYVLKKRGKRHDYFTSGLPWTQKGDAVTLPLGTSAPVYGAGTVAAYGANSNATLYQAWNATDGAAQYGTIDKTGGAVTLGLGNLWAGTAAGDGVQSFSLATAAQYTAAGSSVSPPFADLSNATAATINSLREAFQLQRMLERDARGGTRYIEILKSHFGVVSPDFRLQRPEFLGGGSTPIIQAPIPQTSPTSGSNAQGDLAAIGTFSHSGVGFNKSFVEHGLVIGLLCVRADLTYQQGLNRMWSRSTRYDFYWPALSHLGEQAILNQEIYCQGSGNPTQDAAAFAYQERFAEYRYSPSQITGKFRSTYASSLDVWHLAEEFGALPTLGNTFIQQNTPMSRIKAVTAEPDFLLDVLINQVAARPMPVYSVPGLIDHF